MVLIGITTHRMTPQVNTIRFSKKLDYSGQGEMAYAACTH